jgi:farnesyl diphosphate synthase
MILEKWDTLRERVDGRLNVLLESLNVPSERLYTAMQYVLLSPGKRMRPVLIYLTGKALGIPLQQLDNIACAVECMHAYSLIHDDLPAMDDDDLRRGKPSCHRAFDEATAILAGDALQALAFQQTLQAPLLSAEQKNNMAILLSLSCGAEGMVSGQSMDLLYLENDTFSLKLLEQIHSLKTGVLFETCIRVAIVAAPNAPEALTINLNAFAKYFGLAFQIQDDYLDAYGETKSLGKKQGSDEKQGKKTYVNLYAQEELNELIQTTYRQAKHRLTQSLPATQELIEFTQYLIQRNF